MEIVPKDTGKGWVIISWYSVQINENIGSLTELLYFLYTCLGRMIFLVFSILLF